MVGTEEENEDDLEMDEEIQGNPNSEIVATEEENEDVEMYAGDIDMPISFIDNGEVQQNIVLVGLRH